jgi:hypothetical protein
MATAQRLNYSFIAGEKSGRKAGGRSQQLDFDVLSGAYFCMILRKGDQRFFEGHGLQGAFKPCRVYQQLSVAVFKAGSGLS